MEKSKTKVCKTCKQELLLTCFDQWNNRKRYKNQCRECVSAFYAKINGDTKVCVDCKIEKPRVDFYPVVKGGRQVQSRCIECISVFKKERYWRNREEELAKMTRSRLKPENILQRKQYYENNKSAYRARHDKYMSDENKVKARRERNREYEKVNKDSISARKKAYTSKEEVKERKRETHSKRIKEDINYVIKRRLRCRIRHAITAIENGKNKKKGTLELLGCDLMSFKDHIENQFTEGMTWSHVFSGDVHLDHFVPCKLFNLANEEDQLICFNYRNIRPLWAKDNLEKNAKLPEGLNFEKWKQGIKLKIFNQE